MITYEIIILNITPVVQTLVSEWQDATTSDRRSHERIMLQVPAWRVEDDVVRYT